MSHFTKLAKANITDADAFEKAAKELGLRTSRNSIAESYHGRNKLQADVVAHVMKGDDIALTKSSDGKTYEMQADWSYMGQSMAQKAGFRTASEFQDRLIQLTTKHAIVSRYKREGFRADVTEDKDQNLNVVLTRAY